MNFDGIDAFLAHLATIPEYIAEAEKLGLEVGAKLIEAEAKSELGTYQRTNMGENMPWKDLADVTKLDRVDKGYPANEPLLRDGTLRDSIEHSVEGREAVVGSDDIIAVYQEQGTKPSKRGGAGIPPRPFLSTAAFRKEEQVAEAIAHRVVRAIAGHTIA